MQEPIILDPLTTMIKIGMLHYQPTGTKLNFLKYSMGYDPPSLLQGFIRRQNHSSRDDVTILNKVIDFFLRCYNVDNNEHLQLIVESAIKGLEKLSGCYPNDSLIDHCLQFYISKLLKVVTKDVDAKRVFNNEIIKAELNEDDGKIINDYFKDLWSASQLSIIAAILIEMSTQTKKPDTKELISYINSINSILCIKDTDLEKCILLKGGFAKEI